MMNRFPIELAPSIQASVAVALEEDVGSGDITAQLIPESASSEAHVICREPAVLCGTAWFDEVFRQIGNVDSIQWHRHDGENVESGSHLVTLKGQSRALLTGERAALNFLQTLSGTATVAFEYQKALRAQQGESAAHIQLLDTRKTLPGLRLAQKYAVFCGGCDNHRFGLYDAFLIKENHINACGGIRAAVNHAHDIAPGKRVEVEVESLSELEEALAVGVDVVMLDNFSTRDLEAVKNMEKGHTQFEISGNVDLTQLHRPEYQIADFISIGALTKHVRAIDLSMRLVD